MTTRHAILNTLVSLGLLIFAPTFVSAATYFVAPGGSDSHPGTQAAPFGTIQKAHNIVVAGDTIYLRGGTYNISSQQTLTRNGTSGRPIKVFNYPGEIPILNGAGIPADDTWIIRINNGSWWHIKGLEMKGNPHGGGILLSGGSSNNIIENNNIHDLCCNTAWAATGIMLLDQVANNLILNNDVHSNRDNDGEDAEGILTGTTGAGNVVRGNRAWHNSDNGFADFCVQNGAICSGIVFDNNWAWENGYNDALQDSGAGDGDGFKLGGVRSGTSGKSGANVVTNNVSWKNKFIGFDENSASSALTLYNNTAYNNVHLNYGFWNPPNDTFRNNVSVGGGGIAASGSATFNSWNLPVTVNSADFQSLDDSCARGPRQADGSLPYCPFLRLAAGSDLIDKGTNVGIAYTGSAPDLGAFEYDGSVTPPPPPVADTTQPSVPTGLSAVASASQLALSWNASTDNVGVMGYGVYRNGTQIAAPASNSYIDGSLVPGAYSYTVAAVDAAGNVSAQSGIVSAMIASPLLHPSRLRVDIPSPVAGQSQVAIWQARRA